MAVHLHWLHCNKCGIHSTPKRTTTEFFLGSCLDVLCQKSLKNSSESSKKICTLCNDDMNFSFIGGLMVQRIRKFFETTENSINLSPDDRMEVAEFQFKQKNSSYRFALSDSNRCKELLIAAKEKYVAYNLGLEKEALDADELSKLRLQVEAPLNEKIAQMVELWAEEAKQLKEAGRAFNLTGANNAASSQRPSFPSGLRPLILPQLSKPSSAVKRPRNKADSFDAKLFHLLATKKPLYDMMSFCEEDDIDDLDMYFTDP